VPSSLASATSDAHAALRPPWTALSCEFAFYHAQRRAARPPSAGVSLGHMLAALRKDEHKLAEQYFAAITAPMKAFVRFEGCHHFVVVRAAIVA
jgi:hypothetical protein